MTATPEPWVAFFAGVLSFLSPCVLPLVPGYLSLMSGLGVSEVEQPSRTARLKLLTNTVLFVLGFSLVFIAYGAAASSLGSLVLAHRVLLGRIAGVVVIVMGLSLSGLLTIPALMREKRLAIIPAQFGAYAAPVMGMAFAFGWTPCIGPVLAGVLTLAAGRNTLGQGVWLLALYSLGLGVPFVAMGVAFGRFRSTWGWFRRHGLAIDRISGGLLVLFGILLLTGRLTTLANWVISLWDTVGLDRLKVG